MVISQSHTYLILKLWGDVEYKQKLLKDLLGERQTFRLYLHTYKPLLRADTLAKPKLKFRKKVT